MTIRFMVRNRKSITFCFFLKKKQVLQTQKIRTTNIGKRQEQRITMTCFCSRFIKIKFIDKFEPNLGFVRIKKQKVVL